MLLRVLWSLCVTYNRSIFFVRFVHLYFIIYYLFRCISFES